MPQPVLLCVDDLPGLLQLRKTALQDHGYSVITATQLPEAVAILEKGLVTAVILDYKFEGMDAEAAAWCIKRRFPHQPVVLCSAYSDVPTRLLWLVDEYVLKSEAPDGLLLAVQRLTESKRAGSAA